MNRPDPAILLLALIRQQNEINENDEKPFEIGDFDPGAIIHAVMAIDSLETLIVLGILQGRVLVDDSLKSDDKSDILAKLFEAEWDYAVCTNRLTGNGPLKTRFDYVEAMLNLARDKGKI